jgi:hypothetical protein
VWPAACTAAGRKVMASLRQVEPNDRGCVLMRGSEGEPRELMAGQRGIWYAQQLNPEAPVYNIGEYLEIHGDLDVGLFEEAARRTLGEVEACHLRFCGDDGMPRQYVDMSGDLPFYVIDVSSAADPRAAAEDWMWADMCRPADLRQDRLFTAAVLKVASRRFFWYQRAHHIALDAFSA